MNTFPVKPLADRVIVKLIEKDAFTKSGLFLGKTSQKFATAEVVAVGRGIMVDGKAVPPEVNVGDIVHLTAHSGDEMTVNDEKYLLVTERIIVAVVGNMSQTCCNEKSDKKTIKGAVLTE
jgi:chaperonin GroES